MEVWQNIIGYEGYYKVSSYGRILSRGWLTRSNKFIEERVLKLYESKTGYFYIILTKDMNRKYFLAHRLVALAFIKNPNKFEQVNHKDGNKQNNTIDNLEWCSRQFNMRHRVEVLGVDVGEDDHHAKLSGLDVKAIKLYLNRGSCSVKDIAHLFDVSLSAIYKIQQNKTWRSL